MPEKTKKKPGILRRIFNSILNFFKWLFGFKPKPKTTNKAGFSRNNSQGKIIEAMLEASRKTSSVAPSDNISLELMQKLLKEEEEKKQQLLKEKEEEKQQQTKSQNADGKGDAQDEFRTQIYAKAAENEAKKQKSWKPSTAPLQRTSSKQLMTAEQRKQEVGGRNTE